MQYVQMNPSVLSYNFQQNSEYTLEPATLVFSWENVWCDEKVGTVYYKMPSGSLVPVMDKTGGRLTQDLYLWQMIYLSTHRSEDPVLCSDVYLRRERMCVSCRGYGEFVKGLDESTGLYVCQKCQVCGGTGYVNASITPDVMMSDNEYLVEGSRLGLEDHHNNVRY